MGISGPIGKYPEKSIIGCQFAFSGKFDNFPSIFRFIFRAKTKRELDWDEVAEEVLSVERPLKFEKEAKVKLEPLVERLTQAAEDLDLTEPTKAEKKAIRSLLSKAKRRSRKTGSSRSSKSKKSRRVSAKTRLLQSLRVEKKRIQGKIRNDKRKLSQIQADLRSLSCRRRKKTLE